MKKTLAAALTGAMVMGLSATTFAAANPFSDVAADHWAYDAISQLAADGVVEGYGDGTYRGDRNITRYEMAQMVAKAMARTDVSATDKALIDKLAAEFSEELNNLGVRVSKLEKYADKVVWKGKMEYTYTSTRWDNPNYLGGEKSNKENSNHLVFRLEPKAEINKNWTANARIDGEFDLKSDTASSARVKRGWAQGDYNKFQVKLGRFQICPSNEHGLVWDTDMSGAMLTFGDKFKVDLMAGRVSGAINAGVSERSAIKQNKFADALFSGDTASMMGIRLQYDSGKDQGFDGGLAYYRVRHDAFSLAKRDNYTKILDGTLNENNVRRSDSGNIWAINAGYHFNPKSYLWADYARNGDSDFEKDSWQAQFTYGDYKDAQKKGSWNVYAAYRKFGSAVSMAGTVYDDAQLGTKGWAIGGAYAPFKNVGLLVKYFRGKNITGGGDASRLFGRVEMFF